MRSSSLFGPTSSLSRRLWVILSTAAVLAGAVTFDSISQPSLNLNGLGRVAIAGDFDAISIYEYEGQTESSSFVNGSESLLTQLPNGVFTSLASADAAIQALCVHELKDGTVRGIFVGGNFTSLGNVAVNGVALYNPDDGKVTALDGLDGKVQALLCDKETNTVYVGGDFMGSNSSNAIAWVDGKGWSDLPFDGFDQPVATIAKSPNNTIVFGGDFNFLVNASSPLVKHAQTVNLVSTNITAEQTTNLAGFDDPASIVCSTAKEKQWLLRDGQAGSWTANFKFGFKPTKLRLRNANFEGRGTRLFRFTAFPINGIMNLTYSDPVTNSSVNCDAWCPLSETADFQDFLFVNDVGMNSVRIDILGYYGAGGGLAGIELFQDDIFSFAVPSLNEPSCAATAARSSSIVTGQWTEVQGPEADSEYLSTELFTSELSSASVVFEPHIQQSGEYVVLVFTPGCRQDDSCSSRGEVNITGTYSKSGPSPISTQFFQTNDFDKYDTVYRGFVDAADSTFRPRVTLTPTTSQSSGVVNIVAQKVQFQMYSNMTSNGTGGEGSPELNGLYEYDPNQTEAPESSDIANSVISTAGGRLRANAKIKAVTTKNDMTYVAGNFVAKDGSFQHFFAIGSGGVVIVTQGGLDAPVNVILPQGDLLYLGGQFQNTNSSSTTGLGFVAAYNTQSKDWESLGAGVDGRVGELVPLTLNLTRGTRDAIAVSGDFTTIRASGNSGAVNVNGFAVWVPAEKEWLERMSNETTFLKGTLSASVSVHGSDIFYAGSITSQTDPAPGAVSLKSGNKLDVQAFPVTMVNSQANRKKKRTLVPSGFRGVVTGAYYIANGKDLAILGGHFEAQGDGGAINNLLIIDNDSQDSSVTGVGGELDASSTVLSLLVVDTLLYIGGSIKGRVGDADIAGLAVWDFSKMAFVREQQPVGLQGSSVEVHAITRRPSRKNEIYVAGQFDSAGSLSCPSLCIFDNNARQWGAPRGDISGQIYVLYWVDVNRLLVGGNMTLNNTATYLAIYNAKSSTWGAFDGDISNIPGPVTSIAVNSDTIDSIFVSGAASDSGAAYVMKLKARKFEALSGLGNNTTIRNIQVLETQNHSNSNDFLQDKQTLLAMGSLFLPGFGNASAATFDGSSWKPLLLTSTANNEPGTIVSLFSQKQQKFSSKGGKLATGFVILISLAIALGLVFLLVVLGVLASYIRRQREGYSPMPTSPSPVRPSTDMQERIPPSSLFGNMRLDPGRQAPVI